MVRLERFAKLEQFNDLIGTRTRDFPARIRAPQPYTLPHALYNSYISDNLYFCAILMAQYCMVPWRYWPQDMEGALYECIEKTVADIPQEFSFQFRVHTWAQTKPTVRDIAR
jgi:hypothetical protein